MSINVNKFETYLFLEIIPFTDKFPIANFEDYANGGGNVKED